VFCNGSINYGIYFGANSGLILSGGRLFYAMAKMVFFRQATELNKNQVPQS
jgi:APA family basic amino acid/polyamine antiporter